jgi:hypothetical protein
MKQYIIAALLIAMMCLGTGLQAQTILSSSIMEQTTLNASAPCSFCAHWRYSRATQTLYRWNLITEEWQEYGTGWLKDSLAVGDVEIEANGNGLDLTGLDSMTIGVDYVNFPESTNFQYATTNHYISPGGSITFRSSNLSQFRPLISLGSLTNSAVSINGMIVDSLGYPKLRGMNVPGPVDGTDGYLSFSIPDEKPAIYVNGAWKLLAYDDDVGGGGSAFWESASSVVRTVSSSAAEDFVFGSSSTEDTGNSTEDQRLFFDNSKSALYAGEWQGTQANDANRGFNSVNLTRNAITSGYTSASIGGEGNDIDGSGSVAVACDDCIADGSSSNSVLTGKDARSTLENDHVHGGGGDLNLGHHQYRRLIAWKDHTGTGTAVLHLNGTNADLVIPNNTIWAGQCECSAIVKTAGTGTSVGDHKFYQGRFTAKNISGSVSFANVQFINTTDGLLDSPSFDSSSLNITNDDVNNALTVVINSIPGSASSITHITCTLHITETGY